MTASNVSVDDLRRGIVDGLQRAVDGLEGGYAAPLRRQLRAEGDVYAPAVLCLGLGRIGGQETKTFPCALTLGLLEEMGRVFLGLEDGSTVIDNWGMPRSLNAADALYALGRELLLSHEALEPETRLEALTIYTAAARDFAEALNACAPEGEGGLQKAARSLYAPAAALAAICCGLDAGQRDALIELVTAESQQAGNLEATFVKASQRLLHGA